MELFPSHITVNGQQTKVADLLKNNDVIGWEKEWLDFLSEWYDNKDYIEVQTSGSTGTPKNIQLKKDFVAASALRTVQFFDLKEGDRILHCLLSRFIAGKLMVVRALIGKLDLYPVDPSSDFKILTSELHFRFAAMVINQTIKCLSFEHWNLDFLLLGGSSVPFSLEEKLQQKETVCYSGYAMTETATHIALRQINGDKKDDLYHCLEGINVSMSEESCLRIEMPGLNNGFLQTNDLAELSDNRSFKILGRADNVIISGGMKFSPERIEEKLEKYISVPFLITSLPDDQLGEKLILACQENDSQELRKQLQEVCDKFLSRYERPRQIVFVDTIPKTGNGKPDRKSLQNIITN